MTSFETRLRRLEQRQPSLDLAAAIIAARGTAPSMTNTEAQALAADSRPGTLRRRIAAARLRVGLVAKETQP